MWLWGFGNNSKILTVCKSFLILAEEAIAGYRELGLDALIAIAGEGSLAILYKLAQKGDWKLVGVPKTILGMAKNSRWRSPKP